MEQDQKAQQFAFETISAVREADAKRSVPFDAISYVAKETKLGESRARNRLNLRQDEEIPNEQFDHVHLIADALLVAERIATDCNPNGETVDGFRKANDRLRKIFLPSEEPICDRDTELLDRLRPLVDEKRALITAISQMFSLRVRVISALDYIRDNRGVGQRVMNTLGTVFGDEGMRRKIDVAQFIRARDKIDDGPYDFSRWETWSDLARGTLPKSRLQGTREQQMVRAYYAATEAGIHASIIETGGEVATYRGSETAGGNMAESIIERMRLLVECALHFGADQNTELARRVHKNLHIEERLDGLGVFNPSGGPNVQRTDPFTLDYAEGDKRILAPQKLPLLLYENGMLRPVTAAEVSSVITDDDSGGITGARGELWKHNVSVIARLILAEPRRLDAPVIQEIARSHSIEKNQLLEWARNVVQGTSQTREVGAAEVSQPERQKPKKRVYEKAPVKKPEFAGAFVEAIAIEVAERMKKIKEGMADGSNEA